MQIFISYRRSDTQGSSRLLADGLRRRLGEGAVFFDTKNLSVGVEWRKQLLARLEASDVVLAVIGPRWAMTATERAHRRTLDRTETDVVRMEIELALRLGVRVVPVLVDGASMPARGELLRPFKPLADVQGHTLRHESWDRDVDALVEALAHLPPSPPPPKPPLATNGAGRAPRNATDRIARYLAENNVVTVLGRGAEAAVPDAVALSHMIASRFHVAGETTDLARVSQRVALVEGRGDLCRHLTELVDAECAPSSVHEFLARLPGLLGPADADRGQLVITTSYDTALERAFDAASVPYDLAVFMATGDHKGKFAHVPWWKPNESTWIPVTVPNEYVGFPFDEYGDLQRTLIVKVHGGAADFGIDGPELRDNFVVTEDDYIGYLARAPIETLLPPQILTKLRASHFLFLGYPMLDWPVRVFLRRIWSDQQLNQRSWAVVEEPSDAEQQLWQDLNIKVVEQAPAKYVVDLERALTSRGPEQ